MLWASIELPAILGICVPVGGVFLTCMVIGVADAWRKAKVAEYRAVLVQNMIDKGFSADEIERVVKANDGGRDQMNCKLHKNREPDHSHS
jgi:hypothetical protein